MNADDLGRLWAASFRWAPLIVQLLVRGDRDDGSLITFFRQDEVAPR